MKYFLDTEFHEYKKKPLLGKPIDTIELISIGIVAEDDREYYAICKDFDLKAAWNSFQLKTKLYAIRERPYVKEVVEKEYWLRENVLKPLMQDACYIYNFPSKKEDQGFKGRFDYKDFKYIINKYGKTREQIAEEIKEFVRNYEFDDRWEEGNRYGSEYGNGTNNTYYFIKDGVKSEEFVGTSKSEGTLEFYGYYADYDWVVFCWLFGRMIDLPKGFPWHCKDLKQMQDEHFKIDSEVVDYLNACTEIIQLGSRDVLPTLRDLTYIFGDYQEEDITKHKNYPKQTNEHNALADARWNKELYKFLKEL